MEIIACIVGAVLTYFISTRFHTGTVIAASLIGLIASFLCPKIKFANIEKLAAPIYCGAFVGMTAPVVLSNILFIAIAGALAGIIYVFSKNIFVGVGGKLGTMAFIGTAITVFTLTFLHIR